MDGFCSCLENCMYKNGDCEVKSQKFLNGIEICEGKQAVVNMFQFIEFWQKARETISKYCNENRQLLYDLDVKLYNKKDDLDEQEIEFADAMYIYHSNKSIFETMTKKNEFSLDICQKAYKTLEAIEKIKMYINLD